MSERISADNYLNDISNPLDGADDLLAIPDFSFNRANRDELYAEAKGRYGFYRMVFAWDEMNGALQFACEMETQVADCNAMTACRTIMEINSNLWLGHFDLPAETLIPTYRHTQLFRGHLSSGAEHLQDLIKIAVAECDRCYPAFMALSYSETPALEDLSLALMAPAGQS